jgi:DNA-binding NarL/FixJ family response regulator
VLDGNVYLSPAMTQKLLGRYTRASGKDAGQSAIESLSDRELDVFQLIGQGVRTAEIAARLHLSVKTVETYRERIRQKLDLRDGNELVHHAVRYALGLR